MTIVEEKFLVETSKRTYRMPVTMNFVDGRIEFLNSPFALKDELKAMKGSKWHGFLEGDKRKIWSVEDCYRNRFQIEYLSGGDPYAWFDREIIEHDIPQFGSPGFGYYDLMSQQKLMVNTGLTYHYQIWAAEMGTGKTLSAIATMKLSGKKTWWWVGPAASLYGIRQEFERWGLPDDINVVLMSYERMVSTIRGWKKGDPAPDGIILDECQNIKTPSATRTQCAQQVADAIRDEHGLEDGYVILMTGTPSPKSPGDWWALCEIAWPGFIKEGSRAEFEKRMGFFRLQANLASGQVFNTLTAWRDNEDRCAQCGLFYNEGHHLTKDGDVIEEDTGFETHSYRKSINEVALLAERLEGLVTIVHKKDCLDLPDKIYKEIICEPKPSVLRVASAITRSAKNVITGLTQIRELSDGFQYREVEDGYEECPACEDGTEIRWYHPNDEGASIADIENLSEDFISELEREEIPCRRCNGSQKVVKYKRVSREVACPKEDVVCELLDQCYDQGRIVFFAGFTGSIDRVVRICQREGWDTMRVDGRGWRIEKLTGRPQEDGSPETEVIKLPNPLAYWSGNADRKVAFVAHPKSGGVSLTLSPQNNMPGASVAVFYSNDFNPATRSQAEDRIHRKGMDEDRGATIVDLIHLPTDRRVLNVLRENRKLELMSMGDFEEDYEKGSKDE